FLFSPLSLPPCGTFGAKATSFCESVCFFRLCRRLGDFVLLDQNEAKSQGCLMAAWICADRLEAPKLTAFKQLVLLYGDQPKSVPAPIKTPVFILVNRFYDSTNGYTRWRLLASLRSIAYSASNSN